MDLMTIGSIGVAVVVLSMVAWWYFGPSTASASPKSKEDIVKILEAQGYRIKEIDFDDGICEVEANKDGKEFEIKLDTHGNILSVKEDN